MNVKMDKRETLHKPRVHQGRPRGQSRNRQQTFQPQNRSISRDRKETGETTRTIEIIIGPTIGIGLEITIDMTIGETTIGLMKDEVITGKTIGGTVTDKTIETDKIIEGMAPNRGRRIGVRVETDQETIVVTILEVEIEIETNTKKS